MMYQDIEGVMEHSARSPAVARTAAVLRFLADEREPQSVSAISQHTALPATTLRGICHILVEERILSKGLNGHYWLGPRIAEFAASARLASERALRIGLLIPTKDNDYYTAMLSAATTEVHATGGELIVRQADEDAARQREQWRELLDLRVDAILIDSVDSNSLGDLVDLSRQAGVPTVALGSRVSKADVSISSDNIQAGLRAGRFLASQLPAGSRLAIIDGLRKNANADRVIGFTEAIAEYAGVEIVAHLHGENDNSASGRMTLKAALSEHPDIDGVFAVCDPIAFGAARLVEELDLDIRIVSVDGRARAVDQITAGGPIIATAAQDPMRIARSSLQAARNLLAGARPEQGTVQIPVRLITEQNADTYTPWL